MFVREAVPEKEKGRVRHHGSWTEESRRGLLGVTTQLCLSLYLSENIIFKLYLNYFITVIIKIKTGEEQGIFLFVLLLHLLVIFFWTLK